MKYYAIRKNEYEGIYTSWDDCKDKRKGGELKSFKTEEEAKLFITGKIDYDRGKYKEEKDSFKIEETVYSFVDGSFNEELGIYGCGGFLINGNERYEISGCNGDELVSMRNIAGEILGARLAVEKALELGLSEITIFYDYLGIENWVTGKYEAKKEGTKRYRDFMRQASEKIDIKFKKVRGHIGIAGNEEADKLAKKAVGII